MKFGPFMPYHQKKKKSSKNSIKTVTVKLVPGLFLQRTKHNLYWKMIIFRQATYIRYALPKLSKLVQIRKLQRARN